MTEQQAERFFRAMAELCGGRFVTVVHRDEADRTLTVMVEVPWTSDLDPDPDPTPTVVDPNAPRRLMLD